MAWKRGTQNNHAGVIRKGHVKEFLIPSSKLSSVHGKLKVINVEDIYNLAHLYESPVAFICSIDDGLPQELRVNLVNNSVYLHSHEHPRSVLLATIHKLVPRGCIALTSSQRLNSKVCTDEIEEWTVYKGDSFAYDVREGAIGDTEVKIKLNTNTLLDFTLEVRPRYNFSSFNEEVKIDSVQLGQHISRILYGCIISVDDLYVTTFQGIEFVCRVCEVTPDPNETNDGDDGEENDITTPDYYRGKVEAFTVS